ncbi:3'-5' exonuclease [Actinomyces vulturis]|uniref:3'-5' exonuclease n=1 Tax=Actinomyces vulturis TaxID=1857645 RepID=UPI00159EDCCB|nr:3'-5' exonuclease [Actinomyces vulturis]
MNTHVQVEFSDLLAISPYEAPYAVIDLETTGLDAQADAIIEVAIVLADPSGQAVGEVTTLINPGRDTGPIHIHGITNDAVQQAPSINSLTTLITALTSGRIVVAHHTGFDCAFLARALGHETWDGPTVCTLQWARTFLATPSRSLRTCCAVAGIELKEHHTALYDAHSSRQLLAYYLASCKRRALTPPWLLT